MGAKKIKLNQKQIEKFVDINELSDQTGLSVPFLRKAKAEQGFPHYKINSMLRFRVSEVNEWLKSKKVYL